MRPTNYIGVHFFSPVDRMGLVEIIPRQAHKPGNAGQGDRLYAEDQEDADRGERFARLLYVARVQHLSRRRHDHAGRGREAGDCRECRADDRHAARAAGNERRPSALDLAWKVRNETKKGARRRLPRTTRPTRSSKPSLKKLGPLWPQERQGLLRLPSGRFEEEAVAGAGGTSAGEDR